MKQNDPNSATLPIRFSFDTRTNRQKKSSHNKYYSPKLLTRRTERKDIPNNAFLRRKQSYDQQSVYKYVSPKKMLNNDQVTFLSDDHHVETSDKFCVKGMFELDFSRINAQKSQYTMTMSRSYYGRNLSEDINNDSNFNSVESREMNHYQTVEKIRCEQNQEKQIPSFDTTTESFHNHYSQNNNNSYHNQNNNRESKKYEQWLQLIVKENGRLRKQLQKNSQQKSVIKEELQQIRVKYQELQIQLIQKQQHYERVTQQYTQGTRNSHQYYNKKIVNLQKLITLKQKTIQQLTKQTQQHHKMMSSLYSRIYELQKSCEQQQQQIKQLNNDIMDISEISNGLKLDMIDKQEYIKCLENVIFELNSKIDQQRKYNLQTTNLLQDKNELIDIFELDNQRYKHALSNQQAQLINLKQQLTQLQAHHQSLQLQHKLSLFSKLPTHQLLSPQQTQLITSYKDQISTLQQVLDLQRQHNEKLKKQLSYNHVQLTLMKKNYYQNQKNNKEINILKERNKKLLKKINLIMEDNNQLKDKIQTISRKTKKDGSIKNYNNSLITDDLAKIKQKPKFASQRINFHSPQGSSQNHSRKALKFDSDDQLSFQLSPDRK